MTPLEELQAAHKRLSERREASTPGRWKLSAGRDERSEIAADQGLPWAPNVVADRDDECGQLPVSQADALLIIALHRTIDAQLVLLAAGVHALAWGADITAEDPVVFLARAINGSDLTP